MKKFVWIWTVLLLGAYAYGQNSRGSITGQVTDPTGAAIPNAQITVTSTDTGAASHVVSTSAGFYTAPDLQPGGYTIRVDVPGFKSFLRTGIAIQTQQTVTANVKMEVGSASAEVTVSEAPPLIDTADASTGQVLSTQEVQDLPTDGRAPLGLAKIEYGAVSKAKHAQSTDSPVANQTEDDFSLGGGNSSSNELLLNGVPNMQDSDRYAAYSPEIDAVNEIRVDVFGANAMYGDTSGGTVNITTKSGTNAFHGSASWFYQGSGCSALDGSTFTSRSGNGCNWMAGLPYSTKVGGSVPGASHENQVGGTIGGPIWLPHVFNGRNKLFFFYAYEAYVGAQQPTQTTSEVPTAAERAGDFSSLLGVGANYQLYNPNSAAGTQSSYTRSKIPGNCMGPAATAYSSSDCPTNAGLTLSPISQAYLKYIPLPNYSGSNTTATGENNFFSFVPTTQNYRSHMGRLDYNLSSRDKLWGDAYRSKYLTDASNTFHNQMSGTITDQIFAGGLVEEVHTFSPTLFMDVRGGLSRYDNANSETAAGINPSTLGFPGYIGQDASTLDIPRIDFTDAVSPVSYSTEPGSFENTDTLQLFWDVTKIYRSHTFTAGIDFRAYKESTLSPGYADGEFAFKNTAGGPVAASNTAAEAPFGSAFALFMLGIPSSGQYNISPSYQYNSFLDGYFLQDDWKMMPNLTVSMGVRLEHETPVDESQNRMVTGWNAGATNEVTTTSESNYKTDCTAACSALLPAGSFLTTGGAVYGSSSNRNPYQVAPLYVSPRLGISWAPDALNGKGVVRLGFGVYDSPFGDANFGQNYGFSQSTTYVPSANNGMTNNTLADPFPTSATAPATNPILQPSGSSLGANAELGSSMGFYSPSVKVAYSERSSLDVQYQIGRSIMIDLGYINNHQVHMPWGNAISSIPILPYLSHSQYYDVAATNLLTGAAFKNGGPPTTNITNPFKGLTGMVGSLSTSSLIAPSTYLLSNPEYSGVTENLLSGESSNYNALNARVYKAMGHGLTMNGVFEWSRLLGNFNQLNAGAAPTYGTNTSDHPFHFAGYGTYDLPVGRGRQFFSNDNRILDEFIGGWQVSAIYTFLSGYDLSWGNVIYTGTSWKDFNNHQHSSANRLGKPVFNTAVFDSRTVENSAYPANNDPTNTSPTSPYNPDIQPNGDNYRTFPQYLMRQDYTSDWDGNVQKDISGPENVKIELRLDAFNLLNRPQYNTPNLSPTSTSFGTTSGVYSGTQARQFQAGAHIVF